MQVSSGSLNYRFDFLKYRYIGLALSLLLIVVGIVGYFVKGGLTYHIDFTGGAELRVEFAKDIDIAQLRKVISKAGWKNAKIQEIGNLKKEVLVTVGGELDSELETKFKNALASDMPNNKVTIKGVEWVGAEVGKDTKWNAVKAVFLALMILLLYIAIRSEFRFGVGAVLALLHDVLMVLIFLLISGQAVSLHVLAAVLAVLGYSLNDTIVIFSRIRENFKKYRGHSEYDIVNFSLNQTLRRTILTSLSTFFAVLAIILLGGQILRGFATIMALGVLIGTYSSVYIASAGMLAIGGGKIKEEETETQKT